MKTSRLLTKSDFDGVLCAALLKHADLIDEIVFVNGFDFEGGRVLMQEGDITCNLPYRDSVSLAFEYGKDSQGDAHISDPAANSCSGLVYGHCKEKFEDLDQEILGALLAAAEKASMARYSEEEVLNPKGYDMLSFLMDARTGIGRVRAFKISNYALMIKLADLLLTEPIDRIMALEDIEERVEYYRDSAEDYREMLEECATEEAGVLVLDLRNEVFVRPANRFVKYALFPDSKFAIQIMWGLKKQNTVIALGKSIFHEKEGLNLEELLKPYGGISRKNSGSVQVSSEDADRVLDELFDALKQA
ncbi:MAG: exopolyphosphatase [Bacillota bacterium]|nr:exopolyphosphatase [Bacillota bacterium]